jgi:hypothetical protein
MRPTVDVWMSGTLQTTRRWCLPSRHRQPQRDVNACSITSVKIIDFDAKFTHRGDSWIGSLTAEPARGARRTRRTLSNALGE